MVLGTLEHLGSTLLAAFAASAAKTQPARARFFASPMDQLWSANQVGQTLTRLGTENGTHPLGASKQNGELIWG